MRQPVPQTDWPESWVKIFSYDREQVFGDNSDPHHTIMYQNRLRRVLDLVQRYARPGAKILDLAAAGGNYTLTLAEHGYDVTWNDIRPELADYVRLKYERGIVAYRAGNAFEMAFPECFDVVLMLEVIEHTAHPGICLQQAARLLKPEGVLIMSTPNGAYCRHHLPKFSECPDPSVYEERQFKPDSAGHIFLLYPAEFQHLARNAGLEVIETSLFNIVSTMGHLKIRYLHLPTQLLHAFENIVQRTPMRFREKMCSAMVSTCRRFPATAVRGDPDNSSK